MIGKIFGVYKVLDEALIDKPGIEINCPYAWNSKE